MKPTDKKRKIIRGILGTLSFSSALFVFQACYGTPRDLNNDLYIEGQVKAKKTELPVQGIKVAVQDYPQFEYTDGNGQFRIYLPLATEYKIRFEDVDAGQNGTFLPLDSTVRVGTGSVYLNVKLNEK